MRRNAVLAVFSIFKCFEQLLPDGPELIEELLLVEADPSAKRNAFLMLFHSSQERAVSFVVGNLGHVASYGDTLQLIILELIRKVSAYSPTSPPEELVVSLLSPGSPCQPA